VITLKDVMLSKYVDKEWAWSGDTDDYTGLTWHDSSDCPTKEELKALKEVVETEKTNTAYIKLRQKEYPSIGDQLDSLFHAGVFPEEMAAKIQAVKDAYPRGDS
jgi:hypothetical protein